jgi:hypothetical protein
MAMLSFGGIDVSKDRLDVMVLPEEQCSSVPNDAAGWAKLVEQLRGFSISAVGIEASGGYERGAVRALLAAGMSVRQVNPFKLRQFARASGVLAKNDPLDARMIASFIAIMPTRPAQPNAAVSQPRRTGSTAASIIGNLIPAYFLSPHSLFPQLPALRRPASVFGSECEDDVGRFRLVRHQLFRIRGAPISDIYNLSQLDCRLPHLGRFHDVEPLVIDKECVLPEQPVELRNHRMAARYDLTRQLAQGFLDLRGC